MIQQQALKNRTNNLPMLVSYACRYSDVINCDTNELFPTAAPPSISTLERLGGKPEVVRSFVPERSFFVFRRSSFAGRERRNENGKLVRN